MLKAGDGHPAVVARRASWTGNFWAGSDCSESTQSAASAGRRVAREGNDHRVGRLYVLDRLGAHRVPGGTAVRRIPGPSRGVVQYVEDPRGLGVERTAVDEYRSSQCDGNAMNSVVSAADVAIDRHRRFVSSR